MRKKATAVETLDKLERLSWYARHMLGCDGDPEPDHPGISSQLRVEAKYPEFTRTRYWMDPQIVGRIEGQVAALRWMLDPYYDEPLDPTGSTTGLYDT